jgi:cytidyltransferase-like protein
MEVAVEMDLDMNIEMELEMNMDMETGKNDTKNLGSRKTVIVTGAFQYLHKGHLNLLNRAFQLGRVVVLLNSDEGVLKLKGYLVESFNERKENLLKTGLVSEVLDFYIDQSERMREIQPDIICAGSDHTKEELLLKGGNYAIEIIIFPRTQGISSTELFNMGIKGKSGCCSE